MATCGTVGGFDEVRGVVGELDREELEELQQKFVLVLIKQNTKPNSYQWTLIFEFSPALTFLRLHKLGRFKFS